MASLDHLVIAAVDLDLGVAELERRTGVRAAPGGSHPGIGTRNALVSLGADSYVEVIGVDPAQPAPAQPRPFGVDDGPVFELTAFAVHPDPGETIDDLAEALRGTGFEPGPVVAMSRTRPDGATLHWRLTMPSTGVLPFLIDWGTTVSPAASAPPLGRLHELVVSHPDDAVRATIEALAPGVVVVAGSPEIRAVVDVDGHRVELH